MGEIVFVGLGLHNEKGITLQGLEEVKSADHVFIELYTSLLPEFSLERFEKMSSKRLFLISRQEMEENNGRTVLDAGESGKVVLLVPGDPLIATTHVTLRIEAKRRGTHTRIVHAASIISAVAGLSGLQSYKFGRTVTIPFPDETTSQTPYNVISQNRKLGLHTLCLLDMKAEEKRYLSIPDGLRILLKIGEKTKDNAVTSRSLVVGIANAGSRDPVVKAGYADDVLRFNFGEPPHSLVFPGRLHFVEAEALIELAGAPAELRKVVG